MILDVKVGDELVLKQDGATYLVYRVQGRDKKYVPGTGEATVFLRLKMARAFYSFPSNLISVPEQDINTFFTEAKK